MKEVSWTAKIKDVFDGDDEEKERERQRLAEEAKQNQSFGARVRDIFTPHHTPAVEKKERGWLHEHVTSAFGGGEKAEKKEGPCDFLHPSELRSILCHRHSGQDDRYVPEACPS